MSDSQAGVFYLRRVYSHPSVPKITPYIAVTYATRNFTLQYCEAIVSLTLPLLMSCRPYVPFCHKTLDSQTTYRMSSVKQVYCDKMAEERITFLR